MDPSTFSVIQFGMGSFHTGAVVDFSYTDNEFPGDIGGQLGLWVGVSVITLCEFIQFFIKLLRTLNWKEENTTPPENFS